MRPMNLDREVRHKSEDIDDEVLIAIKAIGRRVRVVNQNYDIPYIAGYSKDGRTIFIDRDLPKSFSFLGRLYRVEPFLLTHETVEKALLDELRLHYLHAHQIAQRAERDAVKAAGAAWWFYQRFIKKYEKPIQDKRVERVPASSGPCKSNEIATGYGAPRSAIPGEGMSSTWWAIA
jgi:hypothetical protein